MPCQQTRIAMCERSLRPAPASALSLTVVPVRDAIQDERSRRGRAGVPFAAGCVGGVRRKGLARQMSPWRRVRASERERGQRLFKFFGSARRVLGCVCAGAGM